MRKKRSLFRGINRALCFALLRVAIRTRRRIVSLSLLSVCCLTSCYDGTNSTSDVVFRDSTADSGQVFDGIEFVWVPKSTVSRDARDGISDPENPLGGFWIGKYEVTKSQWESIMGTNPWKIDPRRCEDPDSPAVFVSWNDVSYFLRVLGRSYRLPNEAEWEYVCRAANDADSYDGLNTKDLESYAWFRENTLEKGLTCAQRVGQKTPNAWGIFDMLGNVSEWCSNYWGDNAVLGDPDKSDYPASYRVHRGGGWGTRANDCTHIKRVGDTAESMGPSIGFRIVRIASEEDYLVQ